MGDKIPSALVAVVKYDDQKGFQQETVETTDYFTNKNIVLIGYPGAFTPTCMKDHIPENVGLAETMLKQGADEILALSVNDPFVVTAFAELLGGKHLINFMADGNGEFTSALNYGMDLTSVQLGPIRT